MTNKAQVLECFQEMLAAAVHYRQHNEKGNLYPEYGICDNIPTFAGQHVDACTNVKENLIRKTASYSGTYHYPVKGVNGQDAGSSFAHHDDKWLGDYGFNRVLQLTELCELIEKEWDDGLMKRLTPCLRMGYKVGDLFMHSDGSQWELIEDDGSAQPYFRRLENNGKRFICLNDVTKMPPEKRKTVKAYVKKGNKLEKQILDIEGMILQLQEQRSALASELARNDRALEVNHSVQRVKNS